MPFAGAYFGNILTRFTTPLSSFLRRPYQRSQHIFRLSSTTVDSTKKLGTMEKVSGTDIDPSGRFKYILIQVKEAESGQEKLIVRGYLRCGYHADILDEVSPAIETDGLQVECLGGGRIQHLPEEKHIHVFGYSQGFGQADHTKSVEVIRKSYPDYKITWSNEGY